ncbi:MAG: hypothetical protein GXP18_04520 [Gammaproteobacteria bacterium]|nr:hypothetical protein [Gammaproteobacteria bacterium]
MPLAALVDQKLAELSETDRQIIVDNYQLLGNIASVGSAGYGATLVYFSRHIKNIEHILQQIENFYDVQTYNTHKKLNSPQFFQQRNKQPRSKLSRFVRLRYAKRGITLPVQTLTRLNKKFTQQAAGN